MRFKSILGAFLFVLSASLLALAIFVQSKSFGRLVTRVVSDLSEEKLKTRVKINNFSLSFFPLGVEMNQVRLEKTITDTDRLKAEFGKIGFYVNFIEIEDKRLSFGELRIADSYIKYKFAEKDEKLGRIDQSLIKKIFQYSDYLPIRLDSLIVETTKIHANHDLLEVKRLKIFKKNKAFVTRFHLANLRPVAGNPFGLDEVWGDAEIGQKNIKLYRLKALHDVQTVLIKGTVKDYYKLKQSEIALNGEAQLYLNSLNQYIPKSEKFQMTDGSIKSEFNIKYKDELFTANSDILIQKLKSKILNAEELQTKVFLDRNIITLGKMTLKNKDQRASLLEPVSIFNLDQKVMLPNPIKLNLENFPLTNILSFVGPALKVLKGDLNGVVLIEVKDSNLFLKLNDKFRIKNLGLIVGSNKDPFKVLMIKQATLNNSNFSVINNEFQMRSTITLANSLLEVEGFVNKDRVHFKVPDAKIDLEDFGNIANLDIKGKGELSIDVSGPVKDTNINLKGITNDFEILGYRLGLTDKNISIELANSEVIVKKLESLSGKTHLSGNGTVNYSNSEIALGITSNDANTTDLIQILHPVFKDTHFLPQDLDFRARIDVDIFGHYQFEKLKIRSKVNFNDLLAYGENLSNGSFNVSLMDKILSFSNFNANKGKGIIYGDFIYGIDKKQIKLSYHWQNLAISSFNFIKSFGLNLTSNLSGSIIGGGYTDDFLFNLESKAIDTKTVGYTFEDSNALLKISNDRIVGKVNLLGNLFTSDFNLSLKPGIASDWKLKIISGDVKPLLIAFFGQHLELEDFYGRINFEGSTKFEDGFKNLDLAGTFKEIIFSHPDFNIKYSSDKPDFLVKNGQIQAWNLNINQPDLFIETKGEGIFGEKVSLRHEINLNSKVLEVLLAPVLSSDGFLKNKISLNLKGTELDLAVSSQSDDLDLSIDQMPFPLNNLKYNIFYANKRLQINQISTNFDTGSAFVSGDIFFNNIQPDVNLKFVFDKAEIPILGKSIVNVSGEGILLGNASPYSINGELLFNKAQIVNELNEFSSKSSAFSQIRFLPRNQESTFSKLFTLSLNLKAENPIRITNSLMDIALKGEVRISGNPSRPKGEGRLISPMNSSRIFFKNNEYQITNADIIFTPKKDIGNPDFDIQAVTYISTFKVFPKAYGDLERFNFDLTSEPILARNSILSLIAFGYTDENQGTLRPEDQQNLTQVGVGSFVFDRFKINDILNKQFGLQVNLGTVIEQSGNDSLLSGRSQDAGGGSAGAIGRTRSATKIELKKRLDEALTLSVSSTMGGSIGQRQSMNLNYGLTRKIQLEGVYELRTNEEGQEDVIDNSIGGDLKFRWTFK